MGKTNKVAYEFLKWRPTMSDTTYDKFKREHPNLLKLAEELAECEDERNRLRVECEAWRKGRLTGDGDGVLLRGVMVDSGRITTWVVKYETIASAVDALMAEQETGS
jgi:hypothetical protein